MLNQALDKHFDPAAAEAAIYAAWEASGAFAMDGNPDGAAYTIVVPPPNVTGQLHVGHALNFSLQDILIRFRRMQGFNVLWQPGTDHAGIATQMVVERTLAGQGLTRQGLGRAAFLQRIWDWKAESGGSISRQLRRLGASVDWSRERFTMDEGLSAAVRRCFVSLHRRGLIYRDRRLVNWDPQFHTAISDLEVESREVKGSLWHLRYPIEGRGGAFIIVATTRPETMLADTAVAVHPEDARYAALVGAFVVLPLTGRRIPIIADASCDPEKGSGAVKITPAHDFNDFAVGVRHGLPMPSMLDRSARISLDEIDGALAAVPGLAEPGFVRGLAGMTVKDARRAVVDELTRLELIERIEPHTHAVPHGDRSGQPVEPLLTTQWFVDAATLAGPAVAAVQAGRTGFVPRQWENTYFAWLREIQPWCISRQLWWGHRIPAWYGPDGQIFVAESQAEAQAAAGDLPISQDEDVLDTWFSSAIWPFSTLGWPAQTPELAARYPTSVLVTGFDIIFFWVARMMMLGLDQMGAVPFRTVYINALVRDERGQKMSKSKGNVIDPIGLIDAYGTDALRYTLCALAGPGRDIKLGPALVEANRSFVTKLWNAARFGQTYGVAPDPSFRPDLARLPVSRWILDAASAAVTEATQALEAFRFDEYAAGAYRFAWNVYCDWFVELAKPALMAGDRDAAELRQVAAHVLGLVLRLLHPAMPFVTEALWHQLGYGGFASLIRADWPTGFAVPGAEAARAELDWVVRLVTEIRTVRAEMNVPPSIRTPILLRDANAATLARAASWGGEICRLARGTELRALEGAVPAGAVQAVVDEATLILPLGDVIDLAAERVRLGRDRDRAMQDASKIAQKLGNADFVARAPEEIVQENRDRLSRAQAEVTRLEAALARVG
jgi:valyl-tRNA synthetase